MFQPEHLRYVSSNNGIEVFNYDGIRVDTMTSAEKDGQYIYVGIDRSVPPQTLNEMLTWFGIDQLRNYTSRVFPDKSRFFYKKKAA